MNHPGRRNVIGTSTFAQLQLDDRVLREQIRLLRLRADRRQINDPLRPRLFNCRREASPQSPAPPENPAPDRSSKAPSRNTPSRSCKRSRKRRIPDVRGNQLASTPCPGSGPANIAHYAANMPCPAPADSRATSPPTLPVIPVIANISGSPSNCE